MERGGPDPRLGSPRIHVGFSKAIRDRRPDRRRMGGRAVLGAVPPVRDGSRAAVTGLVLERETKTIGLVRELRLRPPRHARPLPGVRGGAGSGGGGERSTGVTGRRS